MDGGNHRPWFRCDAVSPGACTPGQAISQRCPVMVRCCFRRLVFPACASVPVAFRSHQSARVRCLELVSLSGPPREPVAAKRRRQLVGADVLVVTRTRLFGGGGTSQRRGQALLRGAGFLSSRGAQLALIHHSVKLSPGTVQLGTCSFRDPALRHRDSRVCRAACKRKTMEPRDVFFRDEYCCVSDICRVVGESVLELYVKSLPAFCGRVLREPLPYLLRMDNRGMVFLIARY